MRKHYWQWGIGGMVWLLVFAFWTPTSQAEIPQTKLTASGPVSKVENPHGSYTDNTNMCAQCHYTHRGKSEKLLRASSKKDTCFVCHDGRGSNYDVKNGKTWDPQSGTIVDSVSGGFNSLEGFTSTHLIEETHAPPGGNGTPQVLECTSCHNPHGSSNHRNLLTSSNGMTNITVTAEVYKSPFTHEETIFYSPADPANPNSGMSKFCSSCHNDYVYQHDEPGVQDPTKHRHPIGIALKEGMFTTLPLEGAPSGAFPNSKSKAETGGSLPEGDYYYVITSSSVSDKDVNPRVYTESNPGHVKKVTVPANGKVTLEWDSVANASKYSVYRAGPGLPSQPLLTDYKLIADSETHKSDFTFTDSPNGGTFTFMDRGSYVQSESSHPPSNPGKVFCLTCHYAHGTKTVDVSTGNSSLKRMDNLGVCQNCHKK